MDGRGRAFDNIFVERLWRSVTYEEVYLKDYGMVDEARRGLRDYFALYNTERLHQSLGYKTPAEVYFGHAAAVADFLPGVLGTCNNVTGCSKKEKEAKRKKKRLLLQNTTLKTSHFGLNNREYLTFVSYHFCSDIAYLSSSSAHPYTHPAAYPWLSADVYDPWFAPCIYFSAPYDVAGLHAPRRLTSQATTSHPGRLPTFQGWVMRAS